MTGNEQEPVVRGYVPGVFDMFHVGHLNLITSARPFCDHLIVGVVTDEVVEAVKGKPPVVPLRERMEIVAALRDVDEVVIDVHSDKFQSWQDLRYDVIFKGDDWKDTPRGIKLEADLGAGGRAGPLLPLHPAHLEHAAARRPRHPLRRDRAHRPPRHPVAAMTVVHVLGTHGVPAAYGGFETAAEKVGLFLRDRGLGRHRLLPAPGRGARPRRTSGTG